MMNSHDLGSFDNTDKVALAAIGSSAVATATAGTITIATISTTSPDWGNFGALGLTTTTVTAVAVPIAGFVAVGGALVWGGYRVLKAIRN